MMTRGEAKTAPMTDEAVQMERLEALHEGIHNN